jgi:hypothetical protein
MDDCPAWHLESYGYSVIGIPVQGLPHGGGVRCVTNLADQPWPVRHADYLFEGQIKLISNDFLCYPRFRPVALCCTLPSVACQSAKWNTKDCIVRFKIGRKLEEVYY